jgi:hypothetical protein
MHGDSVFLKGSTHLVCEDYADHEDGFALVSDGCSSAPRSDVAARLVFLGARRAFALARGDLGIGPAALKALDLRCLAEMAEPLYATFLAARVWGPRVLITVVGDGDVLLGRRDGGLERLTFRYPANAPYYPAYALDADLALRWEEDFPGNRLVVESTGGEPMRPEHPWVTLEREVSELDFVLLTSDGLHSFADRTGQPFDASEVVGPLCAFKNRSGDFLKRRVLRMMDDLHGQGIVHRDDFSAAILTFA